MPAVSAPPASTRPSDAGYTGSSRPSTGLAILLVPLGLGAMVTALLEQLARGWIDYEVSSGDRVNLQYRLPSLRNCGGSSGENPEV